MLAAALRDGGRARVLVELGYAGGRTGCRTVADAEAVARAAATVPGVEVAGVAGFEGMLADVSEVATFMASMAQAAARVAPLCPYPVILSAGGRSPVTGMRPALRNPSRRCSRSPELRNLVPNSCGSKVGSMRRIIVTTRAASSARWSCA